MVPFQYLTPQSFVSLWKSLRQCFFSLLFGKNNSDLFFSSLLVFLVMEKEQNYREKRTHEKTQFPIQVIYIQVPLLVIKMHIN